MRKRIASALLTLVMLLSLIPAMGTTAAAAGGSHPTAVGELKKDSEAYYYGFYSDGTVMILGSASANNSKTAEENWDDFKKKIGTPYDNGRTINGVAYYDQDSGTLYVKGCFAGTCTQVTPSTSWSDVLTVVVDGDTIGGSGWYVDEAKKCLKKLNIEFRNNSTLTFTKLDKDNKTATILGVTGHEIKGDPRYGNRPVYNTGDLALTGSGTLKIDIPNHAGALYCIRARNVSIADNVSLDIKTAGNTYTTAHGSETTVRSAAIYCWEKLNIDTTGTVNIVAEKAKLKPNESDRGSFNAFSFYENSIDGNFNLVNAQSVTLNVVDKEDTFINDKGVYQSGWYNTVKSTAEANGWTVTESEETAKPSYTVTMTPAGLSDAVLNVGTQEIPRTSAVTKGEIQASSDNQSLSIAVKAPKWLTTLYNANRVGYNCTAAVYENGSEILKKVNFNLTTGGSSDGTSTVTLALTGDFTPTAGKSYIVTFSITPKVRKTGEKLESAAISGNWLLTAVEQKTEISSVKLTGNALKEGAASGPTLTKADSDTSYTVATATDWNITGSIAAGKEYYTTLTLTAADGYVFPTDWARLRNIISVKLGGTTITKLGLGLADGGKMLSLTVYATADHNHIWGDLEKDEDGHYRKCSTCNTVSDKEAHDWGNWTDSDENTQKRTCGTCGYEETRAKPERPISFLKINIIRPEAGATPSANDLTIRDAYKEQVEIVPNSVGWYDESGNPVTGAFEKGKSYTIKAQFRPIGDRTFAGTITTAGLFFTLNETKTLGTDKKTVDYSCTFKAYESVTVNTALPTLKVGEAMPLPTVADSRAYTVFVLYNAGGLASLSYDSTENKWKDSSNAEVTGDGLKVKADTMYYYSCTIKKGDNEEITVNLTGTGNSTNPTVSGNGVSANYDTTAMNKIASVDLTVDAPVYGESPATSATVPEGVNYKVNDTVSWSPEMTDGKFGAKAYTVSIPVTATDDYSFAEGCVYTVNGYTATYNDTNKTVSYTFPALVVTCLHTYTTWKDIEGSGCCMEICSSCNALIATMPHTLSANWETDDSKHSKKCSRCTYKTEGSHVEGAQIIDTPADFNNQGSWHTECEVCGKQMNTGTIDKLEKIETAAVTVTAPVRNGTPAWAETKDTTYGVADTEWNPEVSSTFAGGTVYTVKVYLEATDSNRFTKDTKFTINGQPATVNPVLGDGENTDSIILTYQFPATGTGSSSSGTGSTTYTVTVLGSKNGSVTADRKTASAGTTVTLTVSPDKGYTLEALTVLDKNDKEIKLTAKNGKYTFTMPASNVEVEATFKAAKSGNPFVDVPSGAYYEDAVIWAVKEGVTGGTSATTFNPNGICTRAQAVTFLWRAAGSPAPKSTVMPFTDIPAGSYYEQAVLWAVENGITKGTSDTTFSPNATCSRAQIVTFLWRSQKSPAAGSVNPFTDVSADAYYADAVLWAVKESVTSGTTATTFSPNADCTRAQIVTFIYRALAE